MTNLKERKDKWDTLSLKLQSAGKETAGLWEQKKKNDRGTKGQCDGETISKKWKKENNSEYRTPNNKYQSKKRKTKRSRRSHNRHQFYKKKDKDKQGYYSLNYIRNVR